MLFIFWVLIVDLMAVMENTINVYEFEFWSESERSDRVTF